jgi:hypothetical protein
VCSIFAKPNLHKPIGRATAEKAKMSEAQSAYMQRLHYSWYLQAMNSLFGAEAKQLYRKMSRCAQNIHVSPRLCRENIKDYT